MSEIATRTPMQEVVAQVRGAEFKQQIANALPNNVTPDRFVRVAVTAIQSTPELITATRASLFASIVKCAQDGLLPDGREAALVLFKVKGEQRCQYLPMIGGYRKIAAKHGFTIVAEVVRAKDLFEWTKVPPKLEHKPALGDRGEVVCVYGAAFDREWRFVTTPVVMDVPEIEKVRAVSRAATSEYGPWVNWWDRMACKTVGRRVYQELPLPDLDEQAARIIEAADSEADLPSPNGQAMTLDEANIAAPLGNMSPPHDDGPDDGEVLNGEYEQPPLVDA